MDKPSLSSSADTEVAMAKRNALRAAEMALRSHAMRFPEVTEEFPWGHRALKVKGKAFLFLYREDDFLSLSVKLPESRYAALRLPFASPTQYGLGKSGWVISRFQRDEDVPVEMLVEWLSESYRAIAPKRIVARVNQAPQKKGDKQSRRPKKR